MYAEPRPAATEEGDDTLLEALRVWPEQLTSPRRNRRRAGCSR
jgi:hypothetical protein